MGGFVFSCENPSQNGQKEKGFALLKFALPALPFATYQFWAVSWYLYGIVNKDPAPGQEVSTPTEEQHVGEAWLGKGKFLITSGVWKGWGPTRA